MNPKVSIIIVNYKVKEKVLKCIKSIYESKPKANFEVIVVDNSQEKSLKKDLAKIYPNVEYLESSKNVGYGAGNNLGAGNARGEYLFFTNPDVQFFKQTIDQLVDFLDKNHNAGIVSPLLVDKENKPFILQGTEYLTPLKALVVLSFLNKIPNPVSRKFWLKEWNHKNTKEVDVCPGTALMISSKLFKKISGFDKRFFLYFEEDDISKRVKDLGYKIYIHAQSKIFHEVGASTKQLKNSNVIFAKSRFLYFKKYHGIVNTLLVEAFLKITKISLAVTVIVLTALFLRVFNLENSMRFIGDQGWFYLSARDLLVNGQFPLVGITSSHTWLHQGPLWTYALSVALFLSNYNPISGACLTGFLGMVATYSVYRVSRELFSLRVGIISALLYAVSSLIVYFDRMAFDPSPIPLFTTLYLYAIYRWIKGNVNYFPIILLLAAVLYNLELATFTLVFPFALIFIYGAYKRKKWITDLLTKKTIALSIALPLIIMAPVIIYDFGHGFKQTVVFLGWIVYKPFSFFFKPPVVKFSESFPVVLGFIATSAQKLLITQSLVVSLIIFMSSIAFLLINLKNKFNLAKGLLLLFLLISLTGIIVNQTPSDAYLPIIFPFVIISVAILFDYLLGIGKVKYLAAFILIVIVILNIYSSFQVTQDNEFKNRIEATNQIIALSQGREYNLIGKGEGSEFRSFTMNYEYLLWWKGYPVSDKNVNLKIIVLEEGRKITIYKK